MVNGKQEWNGEKKSQPFNSIRFDSKSNPKERKKQRNRPKELERSQDVQR